MHHSGRKQTKVTTWSSWVAAMVLGRMPVLLVESNSVGLAKSESGKHASQWMHSLSKSSKRIEAAWQMKGWSCALNSTEETGVGQLVAATMQLAQGVNFGCHCWQTLTRGGWHVQEEGVCLVLAWWMWIVDSWFGLAWLQRSQHPSVIHWRHVGWLACFVDVIVKAFVVLVKALEM